MPKKVNNFISGISAVLVAIIFSLTTLVIAQTTITKTWNFSTSTSSDFTFDSDLVSVETVNGAHPNNRFTNSDFEDGTTGWSTIAAPPTGWVEVPGNNALYGTDNFLVMKYEAKCALASTPTVGLKTPTTIYGEYNDSGTGGSACTSANSKVVTSIPSGYAIASINQTESIARCQSVALGTTNSHLLSNDEWMTISRNIEAQDSNWSLGTVGQGHLYAGHNDSAPFFALEASSTDTGNYRCAYTDGANPTVENPSGACPTNTAPATSATAGRQRRTHTLSNNSTIWDMAGNVTEWTSTNLVCAGTNCTSAEMPFGVTPASEFLEFATGTTGWVGDILTTYGAYSWDDLGPSNHTYNSNYGIGRLYSDSNAASPSGATHSFLRGGYWNSGADAGVFYLSLNRAPESRFNSVGFRCASDPVAISQTNNLGTGITASDSNRVNIGNVSNGKMSQSVNLGNTETYDIWTYVYDRTAGNVGGTVDSSVAELYANGITLTTAYMDMASTLGAGWWKLSGIVVGANESREYGLQVKVGKTVDVDNFTLLQQGTKSIYTTTAYTNDKVVSWQSFDADEENGGVSAIRYQLCVDDGSTCETGNTWLYFDGDTWETATNTTTHTNTKAQLTSIAMNTLSIATGKLSVKAIFTPDGDYPKLTNIYIGPHDDTKAPGKPEAGLKKDDLFEVKTKTIRSNKREFKLYFDVNDNDTGVKYIMTSQKEDFRNATWRDYDGDISLKFDNDGKKTLYIKLKDEKGNVSDTYKQILIVDTEYPSLFVTQIGTFVPNFSRYQNYFYTENNPIIKGLSEPNSDVKMFVNDALVKEFLNVPETHEWHLEGYIFPTLKNLVLIRAIDTAGNESEIEFYLTIDPTQQSFPDSLKDSTVLSTSDEQVNQEDTQQISQTQENIITVENSETPSKTTRFNPLLLFILPVCLGILAAALRFFRKRTG